MKHLIWEKQNQKSFVRRPICALVFQPTNVQTAIYAFHQPMIAISKPVNFINSSFENPVCSGTTANQQSYVGWSTNRWYCYDENNVPGWDTIALYSADRTKPAANSIQLDPYKYDNTAPNSGNQYAELNTDFSSRLYQYMPIVLGAKLYWSFAHAAYGSAGLDSMKFILKKSGYINQGAQPVKVQISATTNYDGTGSATNGAPVTPHASVAYRKEKGHWESDTAVGKRVGKEVVVLRTTQQIPSRL